MMRTIWLGLIVTSIAARAAQLPSSVQFLPGPVNGLLISGKVLVYGDARDRVKAVTFLLFTEARRGNSWRKWRWTWRLVCGLSRQLPGTSAGT